MTLDTKDIKRRWKWHRDGHASDPCAAEMDGLKTFSLKQYVRAEAKHSQYSNFGLSCTFYLQRKGNAPPKIKGWQ